MPLQLLSYLCLLEKLVLKMRTIGKRHTFARVRAPLPNFSSPTDGASSSLSSSVTAGADSASTSLSSVAVGSLSESSVSHFFLAERGRLWQIPRLVLYCHENVVLLTLRVR